MTSGSAGVLCALLLVACGDGLHAAPDAASPPTAVDPPDAALPPDAPVPVEPPGPPSCEPPCLAARVYDGAPTFLIVDDRTVYLASVKGDPDHSLGAIRAVGPDGQAFTLAAAQADPHYLAVDHGTLYWANSGWMDPRDRTLHDVAIMKLNRGATTPVAVVSQPRISHTPAASTMWLDDGYVYFDQVIADFTINRVAVSGGDAQTLASNELKPGQLGITPYSIVSRGGNLYWVDSIGGVVTVPQAGGIATPLLPSSGNLGSGMAVDDQSLYFILADGTDGGHRLVKMPLQGGAAVPLDEQPSLSPPLIRDGDDLYYVRNDDLYRVPVAGGAPVLVLAGTRTHYAIDATYIYWLADTNLNRVER